MRIQPIVPTAEAAATPRRAILTACAILATLMQSLDSTIANVALPYMQGSLSASQDEINWVLTSYIVAAAIMTPPTGWISDRIGRTRAFVIAIASFTVASVLCALAQTLGQIVLFRLLQGVFGAALVPLSQSLMFDLYPIEKRGQAMAIWGFGVMVGPVLGPTLGGWLTDHYDWRWVFYINVPVGIVATIGMLIFLPDKRNPTGRFDWTGFGLLGIAVGAFQLMLDRGQQLDWFSSTEIVTEACVAGLSAFCFLVHLRFFETPLISASLFKDRNYLLGSTFSLFTGLTLVATLSLLTPFLQNLLGYPVLTAGELLAPRGLGTMAAMILAGRLLGKINPRSLLLAGFLMQIAAAWMMTSFTGDVSQEAIVVSGALQGMSTGFIFTTGSTVTFATLAPALRMQGTAMYSLIRNLGSAAGISITGMLLLRNTQINHAEIAGGVTPFSTMLHSAGPARFWDPTRPSGAAALNAEITRQATIISYIDDFKLMLIIAVVLMPLVLLVRTPRKPSGIRPASAVARSAAH